MKNELQQGAMDALEVSVKGASGLTFGTGVMTVLEWLPAALGCCASGVGIVVTLALYLKKSRIMDLQIEELERGNDGIS